MDISSFASVLQSGLSVVGFLALSVWMMKWAKGLHERNKELGDIDKEIRAALKDSFAIQKELHEIELKKLKVQLAELNNDVGSKDNALDSERKILQATIRALDVVETASRNIQELNITTEYEKARKQFLQVIDLLDSNNIVRKETFFALETSAPLRVAATLEEEIAWRLTEMHDGQVRMSISAESITFLTPAAVSFALKNPDASMQEIHGELKRVLLSIIKSKNK